jgi:hypothetical protein
MESPSQPGTTLQVNNGIHNRQCPSACWYDWHNRFLAVAAGASADDAEAFAKLVRAPPNNSRMPFEVLQVLELAFVTQRADLAPQLLWS